MARTPVLKILILHDIPSRYCIIFPWIPKICSLQRRRTNRRDTKEVMSSPRAAASWDARCWSCIMDQNSNHSSNTTKPWLQHGHWCWAVPRQRDPNVNSYDAYIHRKLRGSESYKFALLLVLLQRNVVGVFKSPSLQHDFCASLSCFTEAWQNGLATHIAIVKPLAYVLLYLFICNI